MTENLVYNDENIGGLYAKVRRKIEKWFSKNRPQWISGRWTDVFVDYLLLLPDFVNLILRLIADSEVSSAVKGKLLVGIAYLICPMDLVPDFIPMAGLVDDLIVIAVLLNKIINSRDEDLQKRIAVLWTGKKDVFLQIRKIVRLVNDVSAQIPKAMSDYIRKQQ